MMDPAQLSKDELVVLLAEQERSLQAEREHIASSWIDPGTLGSEILDFKLGLIGDKQLATS